MPGYLDQFVADDGLLMVPELLSEAGSNTAALFAGDMRATYLYLMIETLVGRPFVDEGLAGKVDSYDSNDSSADEIVQPWEDALKDRLAGRLRGRVKITPHRQLDWVPSLGGDGGRYLPDMALLCVDLGVQLKDLSSVPSDEPGRRAHVAVAGWVMTGEAPRHTAEDEVGWTKIVEAGPAKNYRQYLLAAVALVLTAGNDKRATVVEEVGARLDADRGADDVPWMVPESADSSAGDLLASLAGVYFDLAVSKLNVRDVLERRAEYTTFDGVHL